MICIRLKNQANNHILIDMLIVFAFVWFTLPRDWNCEIEYIYFFWNWATFGYFIFNTRLNELKIDSTKIKSSWFHNQRKKKFDKFSIKLHKLHMVQLVSCRYHFKYSLYLKRHDRTITYKTYTKMYCRISTGR